MASKFFSSTEQAFSIGFGSSMTIVTTTYRYKPPPKKRKAVALQGRQSSPGPPARAQAGARCAIAGQADAGCREASDRHLHQPQARTAATHRAGNGAG
jgi:hypothetical protein